MPTSQHKSFKDMNWVERNLVYPFARGGDQAMGDWFGERGLARPATKAVGLPAWETKYEEQPDNGWANFASELPRTILTSGGLVASPELSLMAVGGGIAGAARDPGANNVNPVRTRLVNALMESGGALGGGLIGKGLGNVGGQAMRRMFAPASAKAVQDYGAVGTEYAGARWAHEHPEEFGKMLDDFPTYRGKLRRGIRPTDEAGIAELQNLQPGDIYKPGKALSTSSHSHLGGYGRISEDVAAGRYTEADKFVSSGHPTGKRGPMMYINTSNARNVGNMRGLQWDEVLTRPDSQFRVTKVVRDADGNVTEIYMDDLSQRSLGRRVTDAVGDTAMAGNTAQGAVSPGRADAATMRRNASAHGRANQKLYDQKKALRVKGNRNWNLDAPETGYY